MELYNQMSAANQELDSIMGTASRPPKLINADDFPEWRFRFEKYVKMKEYKAWKSIVKGPVRITVPNEDEDVVLVDKEICDYTDEDFLKVENDEKALSLITMALPPDISQGFRQYTDAKSLWEALIKVYEGNEDMKQSRRELIRQKFNNFNHIIGETLEAQLNRFTRLTTEMSTSGVMYSRSEINNKLLISLPMAWDMDVKVIKKTKDLSRLTLAELMSILKASDMDDKQRAINHRNSYATAGVSSPSINAFSSYSSPSSSGPSLASSSPASAIPKGVEENLAFMGSFMNCYNAFVAGNLTAPVFGGELDQIHPDDVEEMDIAWHIAMTVHRAKQFTRRTGRSNWGVKSDKKMGFTKDQLRCYNCHEQGHFARECTKPRMENNQVRTVVQAATNTAPVQKNERAMVAQPFNWDYEVTELGLANGGQANWANVDEQRMEAEAEKAEREMEELQHALNAHAFMVSVTPATTSKQVSDVACTPACLNRMNNYRERFAIYTRDVEELKNDIFHLKREQKPLKEKLEAQTNDLKKLQEDYSIKSTHHRIAREKIVILTAELETMKAHYEKELEIMKNKFEKAEFSFKSYKVSSDVVQSMAEQRVRDHTSAQKREGLGYHAVAPPFNNNFFSYRDPNEPEIIREYGTPSNDDHVNVSNDSSECAGKKLVGEEEGKEVLDDVLNLNTDNLVSDTHVLNSAILGSGSSRIGLDNVAKTDISASFSDNCVCACGCKSLNNKNQKKNKTKSKNQKKINSNSSASTSYGSGSNSTQIPLKKQTCFNCGIPGHIARNCPNRAYVPYYAQHRQSVSRGRSSNRYPSRSCSQDDDWNATKAKRQRSKNQKNLTPDSKDAFTKPHWFKSKSSQGSTPKPYLKQKTKNVLNSNSSVEKQQVNKPIKSVNQSVLKPIYKWVPVVSRSKKSNCANSVKLSNLDMTLESTVFVNKQGIPSVKVDWVPKTA